MFSAIIDPNSYHGKNKKSNFFEGWYYKLVEPLKGEAYCFIPGIFFSDTKEYSHSFIQVIISKDNNYEYLKYNKDEFIASSSEFILNIDKNYFSLTQIDINLVKPNINIFGTLFFNNIIKWPDTIINPGSMGFYNYFNFMQCYSQVCALDGNIIGKLYINNEMVDFTGGKIYIEKNWGKSFPSSYIWLQANSFTKEETSVTCSIGAIPIPFSSRSFTGFLIGISVKGMVFKFTSINRSKLIVSFENEDIELKVYNKNYLLLIKATYNKNNFMNLYAPISNEMIPMAKETLTGIIAIKLIDKKKNCNITEGISYSAAIEVCGNYFNMSKKFV